MTDISREEWLAQYDDPRLKKALEFMDGRCSQFQAQMIGPETALLMLDGLGADPEQLSNWLVGSAEAAVEGIYDAAKLGMSPEQAV